MSGSSRLRKHSLCRRVMLGHQLRASAQEPGDAIVDGEARAGQDQEDRPEEEVPRVVAGLSQPIMWRLSDERATSISAAARCARWSSTCWSARRGSCANTGVLDRTSAPGSNAWRA